MLSLEQVAKRIRRAKGTAYHLTTKRDFPPAVARKGRSKFWSAEDVDFWRKTRVDRRKFNGPKLSKRRRKRKA